MIAGSLKPGTVIAVIIFVRAVEKNSSRDIPPRALPFFYIACPCRKNSGYPDCSRNLDFLILRSG